MEGGDGDDDAGTFASEDKAGEGEWVMVEAREVASSLVGEKKPVTEGDMVAPWSEACKRKRGCLVGSGVK